MINVLKKVFGIFTDEGLDIKYKITSIIGIIIRYIAFGFLCKSLINELGLTVGIITSICSFILNYLIEKPLHYLTFTETGIFYSRGSNYALGSILYTLFYLINCAGIFIIMWFYSNWIYYICLAAYTLLILILRGIVFLIRDK